MCVCGRWNCQPRHCWPPVWSNKLHDYNSPVPYCLLDCTPARTGAAIYFGTSLDLLVMMSIVALHLFFSKAGPRRGRLLHSSLSASRCGDLALAPPDFFGQVFLHREGLAFITTLIFRTCQIVDLGTLPVARRLAGW